jgi:hypothetical protein
MVEMGFKEGTAAQFENLEELLKEESSNQGAA